MKTGTNTAYLQHIMDLLTLKAFRPDPFDMTVSIAKRFHKEAILGIIIYPGSVKFAKIKFGNHTTVTPIGIMTRKHGDDTELIQFINAAQKESSCRYAVVGYNYGFNALKSFNIKRTDNLWSQLKDTPSIVLGDDFEVGHQYSLEHHPNRDVSIVISYDNYYAEQIEQLMGNTNVEIVRIQHTIGSVFRGVCQRFEGLLRYPLLILSGSSVFYLKVDESPDREWMLLRNRSENPNMNNVETKRQLNFVEQILPEKGELLLYVDEIHMDSKWADVIKKMNPNLRLVNALDINENTQFDVFYSLVMD